MPLSNFLSSVADKAQSAINASPLAGHLPTGHGRPTNPEAAGNQQGVATNQSSTTQVGSGRSHAFGALSNQIRAFGQQYTSATPVQRLITVEKSISIDFDSTSRDNKSQSKEFYTWGQTEPEDLKDVTDRLAYLNFVHGSLAGSLADKLNAARAPLKALRDAETAISPRRNIRTGMRQQLTKLEHDNQKGNDRKIAELKEQIHQAELEDEAQEQEIRSLKRKGVRESEQAKWDALREYGEKLVLLCQAANPIINALPVVPPTPEHPYTGAQTTAAARASLQRALDNYKTGHINFQDISPADLHRSDTRSFGVSHASELSRINSDGPSHASTPPATVAPVAVPHEYKPPAQPPSFNPSVAPVVHGSQSPSPHTSSTSPTLNIAALNQSPAPIPASHLQQALSTPATTTVPSPDSASQANALPAVTPTIAETGVPVPAHEGGPGPKSGSLLAIHSDSSNNNTAPQSLVGAAATGLPPSFETAEEEKRRLAATHGQAIPPAHPPTNAMPGASGVLPPTEQPKYESAEDEKRRLEREERERILHGEGASGDKKPDQDDAPPGYKEI